MSVSWTPSDTMLLSAGAGLMSVGGLIGLFVGAYSSDVCDELNLWYDKVKMLVQKTFQAKGIEIKRKEASSLLRLISACWLTGTTTPSSPRRL